MSFPKTTLITLAMITSGIPALAQSTEPDMELVMEREQADGSTLRTTVINETIPATVRPGSGMAVPVYPAVGRRCTIYFANGITYTDMFYYAPLGNLVGNGCVTQGYGNGYVGIVG
ncbi:hypothetical protein [Pseudogemmobacter bohemicus]|uniref:hypothetical protein n=1 Tax=Pseudogemmobacter bohemicus TaxID=2250708 RepID=UPI000DD2CE8F|nr:hypothetical protein [Pseudogemmobacter bohemicus]